MYYCDKCGKPASNLTWVEINGRRMEQHLCGECAANSRGLDELIEPMVGEFFDFPVAFARKKISKHPSACPTCGYTWREFMATHRPNCPDCIRFFGDKSYAQKSYDDTPMPIEKVKLNVKRPSDFTYVDSLKAQLNKAVNEERYQDAAELKKKIDEIENKQGKKED